MAAILIQNVQIVNEGKIIPGNVIIDGKKIQYILPEALPTSIDISSFHKIIDGKGKHLLPGIIDDQVHFREPGLTHKASIESESKAAIAGGTTSFMEMPNTKPNAVTQELLEEKYNIASKKSMANYSFFMGATNDNLDELLKTDPAKVCGIKVFMGASTGNMLVDDHKALENIFKHCKILIAVHSEDEQTIQENSSRYKEKYGNSIAFHHHANIRSRQACYKSTKIAVNLAKKYHTRLHILHLSTADELEFLDHDIPLEEKKITSEVCVHHLWFSRKDYTEKGGLIKCNPSIKEENDRDALLKGLLSGKIDVIATDHAPHTLEEKNNNYWQCPSGIPLVQHSLNCMLDFYHQEKITLEEIVEKMCHAPSKLYNIEKRGFIRQGYYADLVLVDLDSPWEVNTGNIYFQCGWSPFKGHTFKTKVTHTIVNGHIVYEEGKFNEAHKGMRLKFNALLKNN